MAGKYSVDWAFKAVDRISGPLTRMGRKVESFANRAERDLEGLSKATEGLRGGLAKAGAVVAAGAAATGAALVNIIGVGAEFEATMMSAVAKFPGEIQRGTEAFNALSAAAEEVGATTEFDAQQAAGALNVYAAAGFSAEQAIASLAGAGELATVSGLTLDEAASTAADSLSALGLATSDPIKQAENLTRVNDVLAKTSSMVNTSVTDMAEAIKNGGNITVKSGQSVETFGAMVAAMAQANIKGAEAGIAIRNVMLRLQNPAAKGARVLSRLGVKVRDADGNMRDMVDIVGDLAKATDGLGGAERTEALGQVFGAETIGPAIALLDSGAAGLEQFRSSLEGANGAAATMATTMRDTTKGDIDGFSSAIDGVKTAIFGVISEPLRDLLKMLTEWVGANREVIASGIKKFLEDFMEALPDIVKWGEKLAIIIGIIGGAYILWSTAIGIVTTAAGIMNAVMAMNPFVLLGMAIVAVVALIVAFWPEISAFFEMIWEKIAAFGATIGEFFEGVWNKVLAFVEMLKPYFMAYLEFIVGLFFTIFGPLIEWWKFLAGLFLQAWEPIKVWFGQAWDWIAEKVATVAAWIVEKMTVVGQFFSELWGGIVTMATDAAQWIMDAMAPLGEFFVNLWDGIYSAFEKVLGPIGEFISDMRSVGKDVFGNEEGGGAGGDRSSRQTSTPHERANNSSSSSNTTHTNRTEVTIRDESGRAEMRNPPPRGSGVQLRNTGAT